VSWEDFMWRFVDMHARSSQEGHAISVPLSVMLFSCSAYTSCLTRMIAVPALPPTLSLRLDLQ